MLCDVHMTRTLAYLKECNLAVWKNFLLSVCFTEDTGFQFALQKERFKEKNYHAMPIVRYNLYNWFLYKHFSSNSERNENIILLQEIRKSNFREK